MQVIVDIHEKDYEAIKNGQPTYGAVYAIMNSIPISEWLSSFNTESAPKCFEAVQKLKMEVNADEEGSDSE